MSGMSITVQSELGGRAVSDGDPNESPVFTLSSSSYPPSKHMETGSSPLNTLPVPPPDAVFGGSGKSAAEESGPSGGWHPRGGKAKGGKAKGGKGKRGKGAKGTRGGGGGGKKKKKKDKVLEMLELTSDDEKLLPPRTTDRTRKPTDPKQLELWRRENHNEVERRRRLLINRSMTALKTSIPDLRNKKRASKAVVLSSAVVHISRQGEDIESLLAQNALLRDLALSLGASDNDLPNPVTLNSPPDDYDPDLVQQRRKRRVYTMENEGEMGQDDDSDDAQDNNAEYSNSAPGADADADDDNGDDEAEDMMSSDGGLSVRISATQAAREERARKRARASTANDNIHK